MGMGLEPYWRHRPELARWTGRSSADEISSRQRRRVDTAVSPVWGPRADGDREVEGAADPRPRRSFFGRRGTREPIVHS
jgi:hypothetical protein